MSALTAAPADLHARIDAAAARVEAKRDRLPARHPRRHPELGNREVRTAKLVADQLRALGIDVQEKVAHTGVVGLLRGGKPGKVVALRADMDALPVTEQVDLPFASKVRTTYNGQDVGVMHACGHDAHVAILLGVAEVLAGVRERAPGHREVHLPARRGRRAGGRGRRRGADGGGRACSTTRRSTRSSACTSPRAFRSGRSPTSRRG